MKRWFAVVASLVTVSLATMGCGQAAPGPAQAPTAAPKAAEPTKAAAPASPTKAAEPAKKVDFPTKGKTISIICLMPAGGAMDVSARVMASMLEKELGTPVQVVNKTGAGGQIGLTELAKSAPDGYTISVVALPAAIVMYLDEERKAAFTRDDLVPLGLDNAEPIVIAVRSDSPYKTLGDLIDAAKAKDGQMKASVSGVMVVPHLGSLEFMRATGTKFGLVHFEGGPPAVAAMLGGHTEVDFEFPGSLWSAYKGGQARILAVMDKQEYEFLPGVPTVESLGYKAYMTVARGYVAPKGTPKDVVDVLAGAIKKVVATDEYKSKLADLGMQVLYRDPAEMAAFWTGQESQVKPLIEIAKKEMVKK